MKIKLFYFGRVRDSPVLSSHPSLLFIKYQAPAQNIFRTMLQDLSRANLLLLKRVKLRYRVR